MAAGLLLLAVSGCSPEWYEESADAEATAIIEHRRKKMFGDESRFEVKQHTVDVETVGVAGQTEDFKRTPPPEPVATKIVPDGESAKENGEAREGTETKGTGGPSAGEESSRTPAHPEGATSPDPGAASGTASAGRSAPLPVPREALRTADERTPKVPSQVLSLEDALALAFANNRQYQSQKEATYISALQLTLAQHNFAPRFLGMIGGDYTVDSTGESGGLNSNFGLNLLLVNGARLSINALNNFFQYFTGDRRAVASTLFQGTLTQPLLRGFGTEIVREPLTQAERDVVYEIRSLERERKSLAVQVISQYFRVLQTRDRVNNAYSDWQSLVTSRARIEALAEAERVPRFQVDQARQDELTSQNDWVNAVELYENALDQFKLVLAISTDSSVSLDPAELDKLTEKGVSRPEVESAARAVEIALANRLDLQTTREQVEDAARKVTVARDGLRAQLDVTAVASLPSGSEGSGAQQPVKFTSDSLAYGFGFDLDLPLDRKAERNAYVRSLINLESRRRSLSQQRDTVRLNVRQAYRGLESELASYKIQEVSVALAATRVDSTTILLQAGRAATRDLLDSQRSLTAARNSLTASLINYTVARYELLRDMEVLQVGDEGRVRVEFPSTEGDDGELRNRELTGL